VSNPFKILVVVAVVVAIVLAAGFSYIVFLKSPGHVSRSVTEHSLVEPV
jgi:hypothetical protein